MNCKNNQLLIMQSSQPGCFECGSKVDLIAYDEKDSICRKCQEEQIKLMREFKQKRTHKFPQIDLILEGLYLGNQDAATTLSLLQQRNITAICVCGAHLDTPFREDPKFAYFLFEIQDFPKQSIIQHFDPAHGWISKMRAQNRNVLVHCAAGVSRSASFMIAYLMREKRLPYHEALSFVKERRKWANPNSGFREQLIEYNKRLELPAPPPEFQPPSFWMN